MTTDQKRALGFGAVGLAGLAIIARRRSGSGTTRVVSPQGSIAPYTPQTPIPLPPGESVYDPNNGALLTTPTGFPTPAPQAVAPAAPGYQVNVTYPKPVTARKPTQKKPAKRKPAPHPARAHTKRHAKKPKVKHG